VQITVGFGGGGGGYGGATNRAIGVVAEPQVNARGMKRVFARAQLPDFFAVGEHRQAYRTLAADLLRVHLFLVLDACVDSGKFDLTVGCLRRDGGLCGGGIPAAAASRRRRREGQPKAKMNV